MIQVNFEYSKNNCQCQICSAFDHTVIFFFLSFQILFTFLKNSLIKMDDDFRKFIILVGASKGPSSLEGLTVRWLSVQSGSKTDWQKRHTVDTCTEGTVSLTLRLEHHSLPRVLSRMRSTLVSCCNSIMLLKTILPPGFSLTFLFFSLSLGLDLFFLLSNWVWIFLGQPAKPRPLPS